MIKLKLFLVSTLVFCVCSCQNTKINKETLKLKKEQLTKSEKKLFSNIIKGLDTLNVKDSKKHVEDYINYFQKQKEEISGRALNIRKIDKTKEEQKFKIDTTEINYLINKLKTESTFEQTFEDNISEIDLKVFWPNTYIDKKFTTKSIFYHDQTINDTIKNTTMRVLQHYSPSFNSLKLIDSISIEANFTYIKKFDAVDFNKNELGVKKQDIALLELRDNYVYFTSDKPEDFFLIEAYNKEGTALSVEQQWRGLVPGQEAVTYNNKIKLLEQAKASLNKVKTKKEALLILENLDINIVLERRAHKHFQYSFKGNIDHIKICSNKQIGKKTVVFTSKNNIAVRPVYINKLENSSHFINTNGEFLFASNKTDLDFINNFFLKEEENYYFLNLEKKKLQKLNYNETIYKLTDSLVQISNGKLEAIFNKKNKNITGFVYDKIIAKKDESNNIDVHIIGTLKLKNKKAKVVFNKQGKIASSNQFSGIDSFYNGYAIASSLDNPDKKGVINYKGEITVLLEYNYIKKANFYGNLFWVKKDSNFGIINNQGKIVLPIEYNYIDHVSLNGLTGVQKTHSDYSWGYVNNKGELVIPPVHFPLNSFSKIKGDTGNKIIASKNKKHALINYKGEYLIKYTDEKIVEVFENDTLFYKVGNKKYDKTGNLIK